jgi:putative transposase
VRTVVNAIFYLLRTGCQWRLLPHQFPPWGTVYYYFRSWENSGIWVQLHRAIYEQVRITAGRLSEDSLYGVVQFVWYAVLDVAASQ